MDSKILEISLISAQNLKTPSTSIRRMQTYAVAWIDPTNKLRTRIDRVGSENPTWNEKFIFRVSPDFISGDTSGVSVAIYAVGCIKNILVGTVRLLLSSCLHKKTGIRTPSFTAVHIRRPSGRCHGVLNVAATVYDGTEFEMLSGLNAVAFHDLIGEGEKSSHRRSRERRLSRVGSKDSEFSPADSFDFDSADFSDGAESRTSSSSNASTVLNNADVAGPKAFKSDGLGMLCGLMLQRRFSFCPSDLNFAAMSKKMQENKDRS
ncbi:C2 domain-containing protein [Heracleum sosnowskyi]|uniref:C2 domain-containing protein n=1 Tax=Heracleum sosnowskyi TaxID=360622 RepID=A0AAD8HCX4_9APIA|nr:C2 domain-containing protein [Heracleum sosnowskyi]